MCQVCEQRERDYKTSEKRRPIWELPRGWHCSVIGTCLSLGDLRGLARKLPLNLKPEFPADYQIHGFFTQRASEPNNTAKMLNRLLNRRYATGIKKSRALKTTEELESFWAEALEAGDIPGPYWVLLSHPCASYDLSERAFAEVHMISHIAGASNPADIRKIQSFEEEQVRSRKNFARQRRRNIERLREKDQEIQKLKKQAMELRSRIELLDRKAQDAIQCSIPDTSFLEMELGNLKEKVADSAGVIAELQLSNKRYAELVDALHEENKSLELPWLQGENTGSVDGPFDLEGCRILYVGGRPKTALRLRSLVESWNGALAHHDGGLERSMSELSRAVATTDIVNFPTDCISHDAVSTVKRLCRQSTKPYKPIRSSGIASFVSGLKETLDRVSEPMVGE